MTTPPIILRLLLLPFLSSIAHGQAKISGTITDQADSRPLEFIAVSLKNQSGQSVLSAVTNAKGEFAWDAVPYGTYHVSFGAVGQTPQKTQPFTTDTANTRVSLGRLSIALPNGDVVQLDKFQITSSQQRSDNSIDRKIYSVGKDLQSAAGSATDLLQNVPAVQVDIEGNVSLRGSSNVLVLINGKSSTLMGRNRAAALEQLPADGIERIEVITNPSAKYKPDGTAGIINIVLKKKHEPGYSVGVRANVGNEDRYNFGITANYNPGPFNVYGSFNVRQDDRPRRATDIRSFPDQVNGGKITTIQITDEQARPLSRIVQTGVDYTPAEGTTLGATLSYNYRDFLRNATQHNTTRASDGSISSDYERRRSDPEYEKDLELGVTLTHAFEEAGREINVEVKNGRVSEQEDNTYANVYFSPAIAATSDRTLIHVVERSTEASADYAHPLSSNAKIELGYSGLFESSDFDFHISDLNPGTNSWVTDLSKSNRFQYDSTIHALYGTYDHHIGSWSTLVGLRFEHAQVDTNQVTVAQQNRSNHDKLYPTLHLSYDLPNQQQLQANYSHRVRRPEGDDLNPFPEYQDPFNLRAGNPNLRPEQIHSVEAGWQFKQEDTTYLATMYYRYRYNGITEVTRFTNNNALLTTKENLSTSQSSGLELGISKRFHEKISLNFSGNVYRSEIDAGNLGLTQAKTAIAWDSKVNLGWDVSKSTLVQANFNYAAKRLTPQGYRYPTSVLNLGVRHVVSRKTTLVLTVSDVLNSLKERTLIDTPTLQSETTRRRSSRIVYIGAICNFGSPGKNPKDELIFDNAP